jgi:hypothetical protein
MIGVPQPDPQSKVFGKDSQLWTGSQHCDVASRWNEAADYNWDPASTLCSAVPSEGDLAGSAHTLQTTFQEQPPDE